MEEMLCQWMTLNSCENLGLNLVVLNLSNNNIVYLIQRHIQLQNVCGSLQHVHLFIHLKYIGMILKYKYILAEYS